MPKKVLIVDDEYSVRRTFALFLKLDLYEVFSAADALEAISILESEAIDVVVSDIILPRTNGVGLLETIVERWPDTRVVLVTGEPTVETASQALRSGAHDYLAKPVSAERLREVVLKAVRQKELVDENARLQRVNDLQRQELGRLVELRTAQVNDTRQALIATEARLSGLAANVPGVLVQFRYRPALAGDYFEVPYLAARAADMLGLDPNLVCDSPELFLNAIHPEDRAQLLAALRTAEVEGDGPILWQGRFIGPPQRWFEASARRQSISKDLWAAVLVDITERKALQARVMQSDRLATLGTLAAGVAHEINNPLTYLLNNLTLLRGNSALSVAARNELLDEALDGAARVRDIVRGLKTFSRPSEDAPVSVNLQRVMDSSIRMAQAAVRHRAALHREYQNVPQVLANPSHLGQVFLNLIVNAAQAIRKGGSATQHRITLRTYVDPGGRIVAEVEDTGPGMTPEVRERVFEPFFTTKPPGEGTGLGLYICRDIIQATGGTLELETVPGRGTLFRVILPQAPRDSQPESLGRAPESQPSQQGLRILVIDDEPMIGRSMRRLLTGNTVTLLTSGRDALALLAREDFDVVFCDLMMPDLSGIDVYRELQSKHPRRAERMIFMSGGAFTDEDREFLGTVRNPRLDKPLDFESVNAALTRVSSLPPPAPGVG
ncbi:MAG: sensory box histidine kinase/response regulator [Pseudomonadota bacterium]|jgi:signal transduction histidine kinase